jgi:MSHA pilin protein MshC
MSPRVRIGGFTMIELVTVMIIIGIMAAVAIPKFADRPFDQRGFRDVAAAAIQQARRMAIGGRRYSCVTVSATSLAVTRDTTSPESVGAAVNCTASLALATNASGCAANAVCAPSGVGLTGSTSLIFDPLGRLVTAPNTVAAAAATIGVTAAGQPNMTITVQPETGYVQ